MPDDPDFRGRSRARALTQIPSNGLLRRRARSLEAICPHKYTTFGFNTGNDCTSTQDVVTVNGIATHGPLTLIKDRAQVQIGDKYITHVHTYNVPRRSVSRIPAPNATTPSSFGAAVQLLCGLAGSLAAVGLTSFWKTSTRRRAPELTQAIQNAEGCNHGMYSLSAIGSTSMLDNGAEG